MAHKILEPYLIIRNGDMSGPLYSTITDVRYLDCVTIQHNFTGVPVGEFTVEASLDKVNWTTVPISGSATAVGLAGSVLLNVGQTPGAWIRSTYRATSGSGTLSTLICGREGGAATSYASSNVAAQGFFAEAVYSGVAVAILA